MSWFISLLSNVTGWYVKRALLEPNFQLKSSSSSSFVKKSKLPVVEREFKFWIFTNLIIYLVSFWIILFISQKVYGTYNYIFIWAMFMVVSGFLNFANHKKLIWDILSFLELENGVFLLSLLVLEKVSLYIELWIIVDILMSLAILLISTMKIKSVYWSIGIDKLSELKD